MVIDATGWQVNNPPVRFRRAAGMLSTRGIRKFSHKPIGSVGLVRDRLRASALHLLETAVRNYFHNFDTAPFHIRPRDDHSPFYM